MLSGCRAVCLLCLVVALLCGRFAVRFLNRAVPLCFLSGTEYQVVSYHFYSLVSCFICRIILVSPLAYPFSRIKWSRFGASSVRSHSVLLHVIYFDSVRLLHGYVV